ncbi:phage portal protein [Micromonospora carbonacea]|uniref:Phage portal protein n=1 Tax=Micromonospora carbonacea TaxID=47853 RepID=A0A1C4WYV3_9ACTN|nr:phage portal protein [Micromonospora carbonacea]SCF01373.1 Phage portal protein [Micromonospora carbonacea]
MTSFEQQRGLWVPESARSTRSSLSMQDFADMFSFGGSAYPFLQTSMGTLSEEAIGATLTQVARSNGPTFALILARMQLFAQIRFQWTRWVGGAPADLFGSPELAVLERPWAGGTTADLLTRMELDVSTAGNSYIRRLRRNRQSRLVRLRPEWMYIVLGSEEDAERPEEAADVELAGYVYRPPNGQMQVLLPDEVAHYAPIPDPDGVAIGMSWMTPVIRDLSGDNLMTDHKRAFLRNAATPNMVIRFDPGINVQAVKDFREVFEAEHAGAWNAYKTLYLGGGADAKAIGADMKQLDFAVIQGKAESRLASAAGVPPSWVGFSEGLQGSALNAGNFTAARRRLSDGTLQHLWGNVASSLEVLLDRPDNGASLWFATKGIPFLHMDAADAATVQSTEALTITALVRDGFTAESAIAAVQTSDWSRLVHTGRVSVQLQTPGEGGTDGSSGSDNSAGEAPQGGSET